MYISKYTRIPRGGSWWRYTFQPCSVTGKKKIQIKCENKTKTTKQGKSEFKNIVHEYMLFGSSVLLRSSLIKTSNFMNVYMF